MLLAHAKAKQTVHSVIIEIKKKIINYIYNIYFYAQLTMQFVAMFVMCLCINV